MNTEQRPRDKQLSPREQRLVAACGLIVAYSGLAGFAMTENRFGHFAYSAMVLSGVLMVLPHLIARAVSQCLRGTRSLSR